MNGWQFMGAHPILTFILALILLDLVTYPFKILNRWIRHRNIAVRGWPPEHLDADGDFNKQADD